MKLITIVLLALVIAAGVNAETTGLGMGAFSSESGAILMTVDASLVNRTVDSPYVMFVVYMAAKDGGRSISVAAKDVVMVYNGREYAMPTVKELRASYAGGIRDLEFYRRLGKEGVNASWVRMYQFPETANFFPPLALGQELAVDTGHMVGNRGFLTPLYFKNPGLAKGERLTIKIRDQRDPGLSGECEVVLD